MNIITQYLERVYEQLANWPVLNGFEISSLVLAIVGVLLSLYPIIGSWREGNLLMLKARENLRTLIRSRIDDPELLKPTSIKSLALGLQLNFRCPEITDPMISETIRLVALEVELNDKGVKRRRRLQALDIPLRAFDPNGPNLASIASRDPLLAYLLSFFGFVLMMLFGILLILQADIHNAWKNTLLVISILCQSYLLLMAVRAFLFWKESNAGSRVIRNDVFRKLFIGDTESRFDYILYHTTKTVHHIWAPIWETVAFGMMPTLGIISLPLWTGYLTILGARHWELTEEITRRIVLWETIAILAIGISFFYFFAVWHEYRHFEKTKLRKKLGAIQRDIVIMERGYKKMSEREINEKILLCRQLWLFTGNPYYKDCESRLSSFLPPSQ